ncbi:MAG TPA: GMC oxidoreductase [Longimicrobiaceae bacterium]|nr:GMC oxidoreductase [Longimicrobiaceae bacterium]
MSEPSRSTLEKSVVVVGSGFGGCVTACRLAEAGYHVTVLERGREWTRYPRKVNDPWIFDSRKPEKWNGWVEFHIWRKMVVATGAGVGGGSLIYANLSLVAPESNFQQGWPKEITYQGLLPHYDEVGRVLGLEVLPDNQLNARTRLVREGAEAIGAGARFRKLDLAVRFAKDFPAPDPRRDTGERFLAEGQKQCVHCGNCDLGCQENAKNTLDFNYLKRARAAGAEVRSLHQVEYVEPIKGGYRVHFWVIDPRRHARKRGSIDAERVVLAAGSLGSTEILLRSRDQHRTLPRISRFLGHNWSSNGDFLTLADYPQRQIDPSFGPTISCGIDYLDADRTPRFIIEDGGLPPVLRNFRLYLWGNRLGRAFPPLRPLIEKRMEQVRARDDSAHTMPWFANGVDGSDGRLRLGRRWYTPWRRELLLNWNPAKSAELIDGIIAKHKELIKATGGERRSTWTWDLFRWLITPHPLGGCNLGNSPADGVVDHRGQVFEYPNLYVADGAVIPEAVGLNPSRTIAAVAERIAAIMLEEDGHRLKVRAPEKIVGAPETVETPAAPAA